jgi:hypothetical protein
MSEIFIFNWVRLSKQRKIHHWMQSFFCMYDYNFEFRYELKDDIIMNKVLVVTKYVKELIKYKQKLIERWQKATNA